MTPGSTRSLLQVGIGLAAFAVLVFALDRARPRPEPVADAGLVPAAAVPAAPGITASAPEPAPAAIPPSVDVVRVAPDGAALVAGRAQPGANVTLYAGDTEMAEAKADADGNFVAIFKAEPSAEPRTLTLGSETADGARAVSDQVVVLLPEVPGVSHHLDQAGPAAAPEPVAPEPTTEASAAAAPAVAATAILSPDSVELTPLARPTGAAADRVSLASISYAEAGEISLAGFGRAGSKLRAYVDDAFAREGEVAADGRWNLALGDVSAGVYRLRIDQIGADGVVQSRVVTPFQRDYPQPQPRPTADGAAAPVSIIVQPGNNLWTLARLHYGSGVLYTQIFTANSDLIGDPDLIYPGQIFRLPEQAANR